MLRSAISAFTRVFDALWFAAWCAADPGSISVAWVPALRSSAKALHRVRDTGGYLPSHFGARFSENAFGPSM
jgi:hypothetical protein